MGVPDERSDPQGQTRRAALEVIVAAGRGDGVGFSAAFDVLEASVGTGGVYGQLWSLCQDLSAVAVARGASTDRAGQAGNVPGDQLVAAQVERFTGQLAAGVDAADLYVAGQLVNVRGDAVALASLACGLVRCAAPAAGELTVELVEELLEQ